MDEAPSLQPSPRPLHGWRRPVLAVATISTLLAGCTPRFHTDTPPAPSPAQAIAEIINPNASPPTLWEVANGQYFLEVTQYENTQTILLGEDTLLYRTLNFDPRELAVEGALLDQAKLCGDPQQLPEDTVPFDTDMVALLYYSNDPNTPAERTNSILAFGTSPEASNLFGNSIDTQYIAISKTPPNTSQPASKTQ